jgi:hypothetical protein
MRASWEEEALAAGIPAPPSVVTATQYLEHKPREVPRSLLSLAPPARGGGSAGRNPSSPAPPPLPRLTLDDYEELEAEPDEDEDEDEESSLRLADPSSTFHEASLHEAVTEWPPADSGAVEHVPTLPPEPMMAALASSPPPLPTSALDDEDMRPEQPTVLIPPADDDPAAHQAALEALPTDAPPAWPSADPEASAQHPSQRYPSDRYASEQYSAAEASGQALRGEPDEHSGAASAAPAKLKARVHHQAVRVSLSPDARMSGHFLVRPLREGEAPAPGERVALLVALEPGSPLV